MEERDRIAEARERYLENMRRTLQKLDEMTPRLNVEAPCFVRVLDNEKGPTPSKEPGQ